MADNEGKTGFSIPRIVEVLVTASIVGGVTLYGTTAVIEERLAFATETAESNKADIRELRRDFTSGIKEMTDVMFSIRLQLAQTASEKAAMTSLSSNIERHESQFRTIWPRLREMKERVQRLEPKDADRWQY